MITCNLLVITIIILSFQHIEWGMALWLSFYSTLSVSSHVLVHIHALEGNLKNLLIGLKFIKIFDLVEKTCKNFYFGK